MKRLNYLFTDSDDDNANGDGGGPAALSFARGAAARTRRRGNGDDRDGDDAAVAGDGASATSLEDDTSRRNMQSLFAQDSLRARQARVASLRYEDEARRRGKGSQVAAAVGRSVLNARSESEEDSNGGGKKSDSGDSQDSDVLYARRGKEKRGKPSRPNTRSGASGHTSSSNNHSASGPSPNPLTTVTHAVVQAYHGETYVGTCVAALCVPHVRHQPPVKRNNSASSSTPAAGALAPLVAIVDTTKTTVCRARLDRGSLLFRLSRENQQYASLYVESKGSRQDEGNARTTDGIFWSLMFRDRREAVAFVATAHTIAHYTPAGKQDPTSTSGGGGGGGGGAESTIISLLMPPPNAEAETAAAATTTVQRGCRALFGYRLWLLQRVAKGSQYLSLGKTVDEVPPDAPREVLVGDGTIMDGMERGVVGMRAGEARLVFLNPEETRVRRGLGNPEVSPDDAVVAYLYCADPSVPLMAGSHPNHHRAPAAADAKGGDKEGGPLPADLSPISTGATTAAREAPPPPAAAKTVPRHEHREIAATGALPTTEEGNDNNTNTSAAPAAPAAVVPATVVGGEDTNTLLQRALLQTLLHSQGNSAAAAPSTGNRKHSAEEEASAASAAEDRKVLQSTSSAVARIEHATDRMQSQLMSVSDKLDRLDLRRILEENNANLEAMMRRVVGLAPQNGAALIEDVHKDRDALLATIERYKMQYEEANGNYQKALEGIGRYADKAHALEADLRIQKETLEARLADVEERHRLRTVEADVKHRAELERVTDERYRQGKADGFEAGVRQGTLDARQAAGQPGDPNEWEERRLAYEQEIVQWKTEVQEAQGRHIRERRSLQAEIDSLQLLCQRLGAQKDDLTVRVPEENAEQQCKRLKRALNAVYAQVEAQLAAHTSTTTNSAGGLSATDDLAYPGTEPRRAAALDEMVSVKDALSALIIAIKSEAKTFSREIKTEAALRGQENAMLAQVRRERRENGGVLSATATAKAAQTSSSSSPLAWVVDGGAGSGDNGDDGVTGATAADTSAAPPLPSGLGAAKSALAAATSQQLVPEAVAASDTAMIHPADAEVELASHPRSATAFTDEPRRSTQPFGQPSATTDEGSPIATTTTARGTTLEAPRVDLRRSLEEGAADSARDSPPSAAPVDAVSPSSPSPAQPRATEELSDHHRDDTLAVDDAEAAEPALAMSKAEEQQQQQQQTNAADFSSPNANDGAAPSHSEADETPMGRLAVRLDYGSAQTPQSHAQSSKGDDRRSEESPAIPSPPLPLNVNRHTQEDHAMPEERGRPSMAFRYGGGGVVDSPIPASRFSHQETATTNNNEDHWDRLDAADPFDISAPGSEVRGRGTSAPFPGRGTVLLGPPNPPHSDYASAKGNDEEQKGGGGARQW